MHLNKGEKAIIINNGHMIEAAKHYVGLVVRITDFDYTGYRVKLVSDNYLTQKQLIPIENFIWSPNHLKPYLEISCF